MPRAAPVPTHTLPHSRFALAAAGGGGGDERVGCRGGTVFEVVHGLPDMKTRATTAELAPMAPVSVVTGANSGIGEPSVLTCSLTLPGGSLLPPPSALCATAAATAVTAAAPPPPPHRHRRHRRPPAGLEVTAGLRGAGHHVVMACRSMERCEAAKAVLDARRLPGSCECRQLDLSDFGSIRRFAAELAGAERLTTLISNAGVMGLPPLPDGTCAHMRPNHLGPYLLTRLLLPALEPEARIVTVASEAHRRGALRIGADELGGLRVLEGGGGLGPTWYAHYARSKLMNVLTTAETSRRLQRRGSSVTACSVSPGRVATAIFANVPGLLQAPLRWLAAAAFQTPAQGARTVLHAALSPELRGRHELYLHDSAPRRAAAAALDPDLAAQLWQLSLQQTGLSAADDAALWPPH